MRGRERGSGSGVHDRSIDGDPQEGLPGKRSLTQDLGGSNHGPLPLSPGKRALTDSLPVQMKRQPGSAASTAEIHDAAARGISTPESALPYADQIQQSFGAEHDVSRIQAHVGSNAPSAMGAKAFATGNHIVFGGQPDLHTAAHEAAHVVQQAQGVNLYGSVGEAGDAYERHADAVADRVAAGQSAADLLGATADGATPVCGVVQRKPASPYRPSRATSSYRSPGTRSPSRSSSWQPTQATSAW